MKVEARAVAPLALVCALSNLGCKASVNADANVSAEGDGSAKAAAQASSLGEGEGQGSGELSLHAASASVDKADAAAALAAAERSSTRVLLGARHDLKLRAGKATASCACLAVALGGSRSTGMLWSAAPPDIDESSQLTIALSSDGIECKGEPKGSLGASYWGYQISGNDVVVLVEAARGGRPLTTGAVIPRPVGSGQVYVAPASKSLPYGWELETERPAPCKVGNPGQPRSAPFTALELGTNAPTAATPAAAAKAESDVPSSIEMP